MRFRLEALLIPVYAALWLMGCYGALPDSLRDAGFLVAAILQFAHVIALTSIDGYRMRITELERIVVFQEDASC